MSESKGGRLALALTLYLTPLHFPLKKRRPHHGGRRLSAFNQAHNPARKYTSRFATSSVPMPEPWS